MKKFYLFLLPIALLLDNLPARSQVYTSSNPGLFGIDGDVYTDQVLNGSFTAAASHDWFFKINGSGIAIFDTINAAAVKQQISAGNNYSFSKRMMQPRYSTNAGMLFLDGIYSRDDLGISTTKLDKTVFNNSLSANSSAMNPSNWTTSPAGGTPQDKTDIVDTYIHLRRLSNANNHLIAYVGASTVATAGNRYFDFEFYKSAIEYDPVTGTFANSGPAATGGHTAFTFNTDGSISSFGDMTLSFSFNSSSVSSIDIYIWVDYPTYKNFVPRDFDFTAASWVGLSQNSGYGYARIQPKTGNTLAANGMVSTAATLATPWGTNSKDLGSNLNGYFSINYAIGQLGEVAIDLTSLGIDPIIGSASRPCAPPYSRIFIKSRASSSFSSALADFIQPAEFLEATISSAIASPANLTCASATSLLQPLTVAANTAYFWSTANGSIVSNPDSTYAVVNKAGTYYLNATYTGCNLTALDSIVVAQDINKPIATAMYTGVLTSDTNSFVTLRGGDPVASNYITPYGGSQGLLWNWSGPNNFSSSLQEPTTKTGGAYQLVVTEQRNGCTDTALVAVLTNNSLLSVKLIYLRSKTTNQKTSLQWEVSDNELIHHFEMEKSRDGKNFSTTGLVFTSDKPGNESYSFTEPTDQQFYYRLKLVAKDSDARHSRAILAGNIGGEGTITLMENPVSTKLSFTYQSTSATEGMVNLYTLSGNRIQAEKIICKPGVNMFTIQLNNLIGGMYIAEVTNGTRRSAVRFVKRQ